MDVTQYETKFWDDWNQALEDFEVLNMFENENGVYIEAEADTGSLYKAFAVTLSHPSSPRLLRYLTIACPWERTYRNEGIHFLHPIYVMEKWGPHTLTPHGGDIAVVTICLNMLNKRADAMEEIKKLGIEKKGIAENVSLYANSEA